MGRVSIQTVSGEDREDGSFVCPLRVAWDLSPRQSVSPGFEQRLCLTACATGSLESAAAVVRAWGFEADDSTLHRYVARCGARAERQEAARVERALEPATRASVVAEAALSGRCDGHLSLVIEMDGWLSRGRGVQWGHKPADAGAERVRWREWKVATVFRLDARAQSASGRAMLIDRGYVSWRGDPQEFGRRVHAEALRRGLAHAHKVYVVADGGVWIWNIVADRFVQAQGVLDFYHASQHLWAVAHELHPDDEEAAAQWVRPLLHRLCHGQHAQVVADLSELTGEVARAENAYFQAHTDHINYARMHQQGVPIGSGAIESQCAQLQTRFKRPGQFWTDSGESRLMALEIARRNGDWNQIWLSTS